MEVRTTQNTVTVLGDVTLPSKVREILEKGPKYSFDPGAQRHQLLAIARRATTCPGITEKESASSDAVSSVMCKVGIKNARPPTLPEDSYKAIFRIRGGFNASRFSHFQLSKLLSTAAGFPATVELRQDTITVNPTTDTVTLSTESYDRLTKYLAIKSLKVNGQVHEVTSYSVPNSETCKGIIYIHRVCLGEVISEKDSTHGSRLQRTNALSRSQTYGKKF
ncbi:hypothetical protein HPB50_015556 [Hyalomma asiaticum]|uniref:Uncharacterized protein n=1 Tax=Hyalomma asiaticum TaxID=266040 RepID=A0ACB7RPZ4_HYAAI|nr:hypothetical protein HPB50_015556 [Hyalomma asiaticum]